MFDWTYTFAGALTGFIIGMTGVGGGALMAPVLLIVFDTPISTVVATDLWFAALTKISTVRIYNNRDHVDWKVVKLLWMGSLPATLVVIICLATGVVEKFSGPHVQIAMGILILITAICLIASEKITNNPSTRASRNFFKKIHIKFPYLLPILTITAGVILGAIVSITSVGAGVLGTIVLVYLYSTRMTSHNIVATDIVHAIPIALIAGIGYLIFGEVDVKLLSSLLIGSIPAAMIGAAFAQRIDSKWLKIALAIMMSLAGIKLIL